MLKFLLSNAIFFVAFSAWSASETSTTLPAIVVSDSGDSEVGVADSASEGTITSAQLQEKPIARPGEVLESIPGVIVTQHSGGGKANQYYLRGFNLDHGTDFAGDVDGVPINLPSHAHGQGYLDLNWLIPELVQKVSFEKGVYDASEGDFANAGSASIEYFTIMPQDLYSFTFGGLGEERALTLGSPPLGKGHLLYAIEAQHYDGAWQVPENYRRLNGVLRYSEGDLQGGWSISAQGYSGTWLGTDQIPQRAIDAGTDSYASFDPSSGGNTERYSLSGEWHCKDEGSASQVIVYAAQYHLDLFSDFTYFLNQTTGDQIEQIDSRVYAGLRTQNTWYGKLAGLDTENTLGFQVRQDWVETTLNQTDNRVVVTHDRTDHISELNLAPWFQNKVQWNSWFRTTEGLRSDFYYFGNESDLTGDSGNKVTGTLNPKLSLVFGPWSATEVYVEGGFGFRTNDARGIFSTSGPGVGAPSRQLPAIIHTQGTEVGVRTHALKELTSTVALWSLWSESDTFFSGDSGAIVDADRPGVRYGVEWTNLYSPAPWMSVDADAAFSRAYFTDNDPLGVGKYIPESVTTVISAGLTIHELPGFQKLFLSLRMREFGPRPLVEDNSQKSAASTVFNLESGYHLSTHWIASLAILNLFNTNYNDNEYFYSSRLKGEAVGPDEGRGYHDHLVHPGEPRSIRVTLAAQF